MIVAALMGVTACGGGESAGDATDCIVTSTPGSPTPEMPEPLASISAKCFNDYVGSLTFVEDKGRKDVERRCIPANPPDCTPNAGTTTDLAPEQGAQHLGFSGLKPNGHVVTRFHVRGNKTEARYGLPAAGERSYMLITDNQAQFVYVKAGTVTTTGTVVAYRSCEDDGMHPQSLWGDFRPCPGKVGALTYDRDEPAWLSCAAGCCVAESAERNEQGTPP